MDSTASPSLNGRETTPVIWTPSRNPLLKWHSLTPASMTPNQNPTRLPVDSRQTVRSCAESSRWHEKVRKIRTCTYRQPVRDLRMIHVSVDSRAVAPEVSHVPRFVHAWWRHQDENQTANVRMTCWPLASPLLAGKSYRRGLMRRLGPHGPLWERRDSSEGTHGRQG